MSSRDRTPRPVVPDVPGRPPDALVPAVTSELEPGLGSQPMLAATSRETRLTYASQIDQRVVQLAAKWFEPAARIAIFIIYFWFGILKLLGLSPATPLATALTSHTIGMQYFTASFDALAVYECVVGILILIPAMTRISFVLIIIHMGIVSSPLVIVANVAWTHPMVPTLEGQYIIKDLAIIALAIGLLAQRRSRRRE
ncbi:MAG: hypothetical protein WBW31_23645 [Candidatus Sulfotelmatobacter sp.]